MGGFAGLCRHLFVEIALYSCCGWVFPDKFWRGALSFVSCALDVFLSTSLKNFFVGCYGAVILG